MAQNTAGVHLVWGVATINSGTNAVTPPTTWTHIPGIQSFPALTAAPESLDATTTDELRFKVYIPGLQDLGGALEFTAVYTPELIAAVDAAIAGGANCFGIEFPEPLSSRYYWLGTVEEVAPGEMGVNEVITTTVYISQETEPVKQAITVGP